MKKILSLLFALIAINSFAQTKVLNNYLYQGSQYENIQSISGSLPILIDDTVTFKDFAFRTILVDTTCVIAYFRDASSSRSDILTLMDLTAGTTKVSTGVLIHCGYNKFGVLKLTSGRVWIYP